MKKDRPLERAAYDLIATVGKPGNPDAVAAPDSITGMQIS